MLWNAEYLICQGTHCTESVSGETGTAANLRDKGGDWVGVNLNMAWRSPLSSSEQHLQEIEWQQHGRETRETLTTGCPAAE